MMWEKKGLIYSPPFDKSWRDNSALTPTAIQLNNDVIRVYASFRGDDGIGKIGFVDVDADDPSKVINISDVPVLDVGLPGMFDDNGVILGDVIKVQNKLYMYYVGFQLVKNAKFLAYSGLAVSDLNGEKFERFSASPVLDRNDEGKYIRAIHSVLYEDGKFKVWYAVGNGWENIKGVDYPQYDINYTESVDGINFPIGEKVICNNQNNAEYRIGRPRVYKLGERYVMNFTYGTTDGRYMTGQAISYNGLNWKRCDDELGINLSVDGWDSKHLSYPCVLTTNQCKTYMFYNGNNMGYEGFGYAERIS
jgi:predicted GH43/DUF377 family glycosyl hydrolase